MATIRSNFKKLLSISDSLGKIIEEVSDDEHGVFPLKYGEDILFAYESIENAIVRLDAALQIEFTERKKMLAMSPQLPGLGGPVVIDMKTGEVETKSAKINN